MHIGTDGAKKTKEIFPPRFALSGLIMYGIVCRTRQETAVALIILIEYVFWRCDGLAVSPPTAYATAPIVAWYYWRQFISMVKRIVKNRKFTKKPQMVMKLTVAFNASLLSFIVLIPPIIRRAAVIIFIPPTMRGRRPSLSTSGQEQMFPNSWTA